MTSIKIDLTNRLKNYSLFTQVVENNVEVVRNFVKKNIYYYKESARYYTEREYLDTIIQTNQPNGAHSHMVKFDELDLNRKLIQFLLELYPNHSIVPSGWFYYPPGGFMSWHTNVDIPSKHIYITYTDRKNETDEAFFRYKDGEEIITDHDYNGITIREFDTNTNSNGEMFWHCVYSDCDRYSFGFRLQDMT